MNTDKPFGGKVMVLGGDFRQILPVIRKGNRVQIVQANLKMGQLWPLFKTLKLSRNMRVQDEQQEAFREWLLKLGDGKLTNSDNLPPDVIEIPSEFIATNNLVDTIFPKFIQVKDVKRLANRAILTPKNEDVYRLNAEVLSRVEGPERVYISVDSIVSDNDQEIANYPVEVLNTLRASGLASHKLHLKKGAVVMLLRNL